MVAREKKERELGIPLQSWEPEAERERRESSRDNLSAFCFRKAKVATGKAGEAGGNRNPDLDRVAGEQEQQQQSAAGFGC